LLHLTGLEYWFSRGWLIPLPFCDAGALVWEEGVVGYKVASGWVGALV